MRFVGMDVKSIYRTSARGVYYCVVNLEADAFAREFTCFEDWESKLFKVVIRKIVTNATVHPRSQFKILSEEGRVFCKKDDHIRNLLIKLRSSGWIVPVPRQNALRLGPRTFVELSEFLNELQCPVCPMCGTHVVFGVKPCNVCSVKTRQATGRCTQKGYNYSTVAWQKGRWFMETRIG